MVTERQQTQNAKKHFNFKLKRCRHGCSLQCEHRAHTGAATMASSRFSFDWLRRLRRAKQHFELPSYFRLAPVFWPSVAVVKCDRNCMMLLWAICFMSSSLCVPAPVTVFTLSCILPRVSSSLEPQAATAALSGRFSIADGLAAVRRAEAKLHALMPLTWKIHPSSLYLSIFMYLSLSLSLYLSIHLSIYFSIHPDWFEQHRHG